MRKFKFRIWSKEDKKFLPIDCGLTPHGSEELSIFIHSLTPSYNCVIQQFTGLKDKNGCEIYEGDIVNFVIPGITHGPETEYITNSIVNWDDDYGCWSFINSLSDMDKKYGYSIAGDRIDTDSFEVVGNMFENPDLLK